MSLWIALILGIVEGLTEFLPISSTGHLILVSHFLGLHDHATKAFEVVIQAGALFAVIVHYRSLLLHHLRGLSTSASSQRLFLSILVAFLPVCCAGLVFRKMIKNYLFGPAPVAIALIIGGLIMLVVKRYYRSKPTITQLEAIRLRSALAIGFAQCFSLWPGTSRAMTTIVAGQLSGLSLSTAAEFSFLLALPTLGAATCYDLYRERAILLASSNTKWALLIGLVSSFLVAWAVIRMFLHYLTQKGLAIFGWYRIVLGIMIIVLNISG